MLLHNEDTVEEEMLELSQIEAIVDGKFPIGYVSIIYDAEVGYPDALTIFERDFKLILIKSHTA